MFRYRLILFPLAIGLATLACGFNVQFDWPKINPKTGRTETREIVVPLPENADQGSVLILTFGVGELYLSPGATDALVTGSATFNVKDLQPRISTSGNFINISNGELEFVGLPNLGNKIKNQWDLKLAQSPLDLEIKAGAYQGRIELGGLTIHSLKVTDGAAQVDLQFSQPNLIEMESFQYKSGASTIKLAGLANANFNTMIFKAGAGDYTLDFSGKLKRDATVVIDAGMSNFKLIVPAGTKTRLFYDGNLSNVDVYGAWEKSGNDYFLAGEGPILTININIGAGNLQLRSE